MQLRDEMVRENYQCGWEFGVAGRIHRVAVVINSNGGKRSQTLPSKQTP